MTNIDVGELRESIASDVVNSLRPLIETETPHRLVDRHHMAELASVSVATLDRLVSRKKIPSVMVGSSRRFDPAEVIGALKRNQEGDSNDE